MQRRAAPCAGCESYPRQLDRVDPATELAWLKVVVKHEAMAVCRTRTKSVAAEEVDLGAREAHGRGVAERYEASERAHRSAEALRALKHDEVLALMLNAESLPSHETTGRLPRQNERWADRELVQCESGV